MSQDFEISNGVLTKYRGNEEHVVIPEGVTQIGAYAFEKCVLISVEIPEGVTSIGRMAFFGSRRLAGVKLPDSLTSIGEQAFCDCRWLKEMTFPDTITHIGDRIFEGCCLEEITIFGETFDLEEIAGDYDQEQIAEDYGLDEDEICSVSEAVAENVASEVPLLLLGGKFENLYMPEGLRRELIARAQKHQPVNRNFLHIVETYCRSEV